MQRLAVLNLEQSSGLPSGGRIEGCSALVVGGLNEELHEGGRGLGENGRGVGRVTRFVRRARREHRRRIPLQHGPSTTRERPKPTP